MNLAVLAAELTGDPLTRGYSGMSDVEAAADLNTAYREQNKSTMTGGEILQAIDVTEYNALSADDKDRVWQVLHLGTVNPFGREATLMTTIFGGGSDTLVALAAARKETISRAAELGLGYVRAGDVQKARE